MPLVNLVRILAQHDGYRSLPRAYLSWLGSTFAIGHILVTMFYTIRVFSPYAYGTILHTIRVWYYFAIPYAYGMILPYYIRVSGS